MGTVPASEVVDPLSLLAVGVELTEASANQPLEILADWNVQLEALEKPPDSDP